MNLVDWWEDFAFSHHTHEHWRVPYLNTCPFTTVWFAPWFGFYKFSDLTRNKYVKWCNSNLEQNTWRILAMSDCRDVINVHADPTLRGSFIGLAFQNPSDGVTFKLVFSDQLGEVLDVRSVLPK